VIDGVWLKLRDQKIAEVTRFLVDWCGSQYRVMNDLAISKGTMRAWMRGDVSRISGIHRAHVMQLYGVVEKKRAKVMGLAFYYADLIFKCIGDEAGITKKDVLDVVKCCDLREDAGKADALALTYSDFLYDRKRFACIVCANILPHKSKRDVWEIVKKAVPGVIGA